MHAYLWTPKSSRNWYWKHEEGYQATYYIIQPNILNFKHFWYVCIIMGFNTPTTEMFNDLL